MAVVLFFPGTCKNIRTSNTIESARAKLLFCFESSKCKIGDISVDIRYTYVDKVEPQRYHIRSCYDLRNKTKMFYKFWVVQRSNESCAG